MQYLCTSRTFTLSCTSIYVGIIGSCYGALSFDILLQGPVSHPASVTPLAIQKCLNGNPVAQITLIAIQTCLDAYDQPLPTYWGQEWLILDLLGKINACAVGFFNNPRHPWLQCIMVVAQFFRNKMIFLVIIGVGLFVAALKFALIFPAHIK